MKARAWLWATALSIALWVLIIGAGAFLVQLPWGGVGEMTAIGPGDWVECVLSSPERGWSGKVFQVEEVINDGGQCTGRHGPCAGLHLAGAERSPGGWAACAFRPIYRPKADLIERLMQPVPGEPVKVKA